MHRVTSRSTGEPPADRLEHRAAVLVAVAAGAVRHRLRRDPPGPQHRPVHLRRRRPLLGATRTSLGQLVEVRRPVDADRVHRPLRRPGRRHPRHSTTNPGPRHRLGPDPSRRRPKRSRWPADPPHDGSPSPSRRTPHRPTPTAAGARRRRLRRRHTRSRRSATASRSVEDWHEHRRFYEQIKADLGYLHLDAAAASFAVLAEQARIERLVARRVPRPARRRASHRRPRPTTGGPAALRPVPLPATARRLRLRVPTDRRPQARRGPRHLAVHRREPADPVPRSTRLRQDPPRRRPGDRRRRSRLPRLLHHRRRHVQDPRSAPNTTAPSPRS